MTPPVSPSPRLPISPSPRLPVSPKIVKKHVTNDELFKGDLGGSTFMQETASKGEAIKNQQ